MGRQVGHRWVLPCWQRLISCIDCGSCSPPTPREKLQSLFQNPVTIRRGAPILLSEGRTIIVSGAVTLHDDSALKSVKIYCSVTIFENIVLCWICLVLCVLPVQGSEL